MRVLLLLLLGFGTLSATPPHPRLLLTPEGETRLKTRLEEDPLMASIHDLVMRRAREILEERTCEYRIPDGRRLLAESRRAFRNILFCGLAWRTTGDRRFHERVVRELEAATALQDWNPSHFLDTAEMAAAVAIGYDWLFPSLSQDQRKRCEDALIKKALTAVPLQYGKTPWWFRGARSNWSQVCASGISLAAEVIRENDPDLSARILADTGRLLQECEELYQPHGGYVEGPGYWHYGTNYHLIALAAAETAEAALPVPDILARSGEFILQLNGPTGLNFNFADGRASRRLPTPAQSWIASQFKEANQSSVVRRRLRDGLQQFREEKDQKMKPGGYFPLHLLWLPAATESEATPPLSDHFDGKQAVAMARTGWSREDAWLALKGGTGAVSHGHLDAGSFVYEAGGVRWFHDLGPDNYNLPGYFHGDRWQYFRLQNHSHNTLVIADRRQATPATGAPLSPWSRENSKGSALCLTANLTAAYAGQAEEVFRKAAFDLKDGTVVMRDRVNQPIGPVRWAVVTKAKAVIDDNLVTLSEQGKVLVLKRLDQHGETWREFSLKPPKEEEHQNSGFRMIGFVVPAAEQLSLEVSWSLKSSF